ncbi:hypothetical protein LUW74_31480 [Actinomadura madurae]|uniref:hypothetical protein n=1 Tax=Actinomadura madurae TaxID=1993 RepID=UPI00202637B4|nr:hypothetical protein [Actinomadura madurae]URN07421.1 hypothetical protein LUW74_31480 [Actinomadura madurae]
MLLEAGRAYARYPFFRDGTTGIPDTCYETSPRLKSALTGIAWDGSGLRIDGTVVIRDVDQGSPDVHLIVESGGVRHRIGCTTAPGDLTGEGRVTAFTATFAPASGAWADGRWTMGLEAVLDGHILTVELVKPRGMSVPRACLVEADGRWRLVRPLPGRGAARSRWRSAAASPPPTSRASSCAGVPGGASGCSPNRRRCWRPARRRA